MGMYDSIKIKLKCPYCGEVSEMEAQTKDLECYLNTYKVGDTISDKFNYVDCITDCTSEKCMDEVRKRRGYVSGFGKVFRLRIFIESGRITERYEIV
jgi:hypothetical protein